MTLRGKLREIIDRKQTNLCLAADVSTCSELEGIVAAVGAHICVLKLHVDILVDFTPAFVDTLLRWKSEHGFLLFEDRKFADIGSTAAKQYGDGIYRIAHWADLVTVHAVAGPGTLQAMQGVADRIGEPRGALLLAEMSSEGNLCTPSYQAGAIAQAERLPDFVTGFISQRRQETLPADALVFTPGVNLDASGDGLGQQFATPQDAIDRGADIIIVGRGIYHAADPAAQAQRYRQAGWEAYSARQAQK